jgi:hypothetical protein
MHAMALVVILAVGGDPEVLVAPQGVQTYGNRVVMENPGTLAGAAGPYRYEPPRDPHDSDGLICGFFKYCRAWFEPMPQTCYSPHFGCYPGNGRDIYRYPAFHGYYYRQAYNYRPLFEYPWQAGMHEPQPLEMNSERSLVGKTPQSGPVSTEIIDTPVIRSHPVP